MAKILVSQQRQPHPVSPSAARDPLATALRAVEGQGPIQVYVLRARRCEPDASFPWWWAYEHGIQAMPER